MTKKRSAQVKQKPATDSSVPGASTNAVMWHEPDDAEFRRRVEEKAYALYQRRGGETGRDVDDWLEAERQVREEILAEIQHVSPPLVSQT